MGWARGSEHMGKLIKVVKKNVPNDKVRGAIYREMIRSFQDGDWDTEDECIGKDPAFDKALKTVNRG